MLLPTDPASSRRLRRLRHRVPDRVWAALGLLGALALGTAVLTTTLLDGAAARGTTLSAQSAQGRFAWVLLAGQVLFAVGLVAMAGVLRRCVPCRPAAATSLAVAGVAGLVTAAAPCAHGCVVDGVSTTELTHILAASLGALALGGTVILLARDLRRRRAWRSYRRLCVASVAGFAVGMAAWGMAAGGRWEGVAERAAIVTMVVWAGTTARLAMVHGAGARPSAAPRPVTPGSADRST